VGDIVQIETGDILPVDGIIFKSNSMKTDESQMTGESDLIQKRVPITYEEREKASPFLISGSRVMEGSGEMIVINVGTRSCLGKLKMSL
jgi:P-type E1-E2 ATPase